MENTKEFIKNELLFAFETVYTKNKLYNMAERYGFTDKLDEFTAIIEDVMYGKSPIASLSASLRSKLGISEEVAQYINMEVDREIIAEVREEFNVAQGLTRIEEYERDLRKFINDDMETNERTTNDISPGTKTPITPSGADPVASSILKEDQTVDRGHDPYREPIDE